MEGTGKRLKALLRILGCTECLEDSEGLGITGVLEALRVLGL